MYKQCRTGDALSVERREGSFANLTAKGSGSLGSTLTLLTKGKSEGRSKEESPAGVEEQPLPAQHLH